MNPYIPFKKRDPSTPQTVAVLFGGRSSEHEISIITALQAMEAMDPVRYRPLPVYINPQGHWFTGNSLFEKSFYKNMPQSLSQAQRVILLPEPTIQGLVPLSSNGTFCVEDRIPVDVYFLCFHGQYGEDGCIQGLLELVDVPYTGGTVLATSIAMDKYACKKILESHGIPTLPCVQIKKEEAASNLSKVRQTILETLPTFPLFVKPCHLGSSVGISRAETVADLDAALAKVFKYDDKALIEPCVEDLLEINISVLDGSPPIASVVEIPVRTGVALTYEDKYLRGGNKAGDPSQGMASLTRIIDPPHLSGEWKARASHYALTAFKALDCSGISRFDFILDLSTQQLYFNELNPIPGSLAFYLWEKSHPPLLYPEILDQMIQMAHERKRRQLGLQRHFGFQALKSSNSS